MILCSVERKHANPLTKWRSQEKTQNIWGSDCSSLFFCTVAHKVGKMLFSDMLSIRNKSYCHNHFMRRGSKEMFSIIFYSNFMDSSALLFLFPSVSPSRGLLSESFLSISPYLLHLPLLHQPTAYLLSPLWSSPFTPAKLNLRMYTFLYLHFPYHHSIFHH